MNFNICCLAIFLFFTATRTAAESVVVEPCKQMSERRSAIFEHSAIAVMYNEEDVQRLDSYNADIITWGDQVGYFPLSINKQRELFKEYDKSGILVYASDIALIQEGGRYIVCGGGRPDCHRYYWQLRDKTVARGIGLQDIEGIKSRAVLDSKGEIVGVPWLEKRGFTIPMACVNDPEYKKWLFDKIDTVLTLKPKAIHFDEPLMDLVTLKSRGSGCFTQYSLSDFDLYLKRSSEFLSRIRSSEKNMPLATEYGEFKLLSTLKLFGELVDYAKQGSVSPILIAANVSPDNWMRIHFIQYLDYLSPEVNHHAAKLVVPDSPILAYLMANAMNIAMFSTAFGVDWSVVSSGEHEMLASAWIAQAYATGQYMNFPLRAWVPGSTYRPKSTIYPRLSSWIKEESALFDGYDTIASHALLINIDILRSSEDRKLLQAFITNLIKNGVLFRIVLDGGINNSKLPAMCLKNDESVIVVLSEYYSEDANEILLDRQDERMMWEPSRAEMLKGSVKAGFAQIELLGEKGIYIFPRVKHDVINDSIVLHLLNRDYLPDSKRMKTKGSFQIKMSKKIFKHSKIKNAILHQPVLDEESSRDSVNVSTKLSVKDDGEYLTITVPSLDLWGIIEFTSS